MRYRFLDYEATSERFQLLRGQARVPLGNEPLRLLLYLLSRAPETVTSEELVRAIWPDRAGGGPGVASA